MAKTWATKCCSGTYKNNYQLCCGIKGFIKDLGSGEKYFFHITSAPEGITEGDNVTFEIERGTRGMNAVRISIINK